MNRILPLIAALWCWAIQVTAEAAECKLTPLAALPVAASVPTLPLVPARIADHSTWLIIDTGAIRSLVFSQVADSFGMDRHEIYSDLDSASSLTLPVGAAAHGRNGRLMGLGGAAVVPMVDTAKIAMLNQQQYRATSVFGAGGQPIHQETGDRGVRLGKLDFPRVSFLVIPDLAGGDGEIAGTFGMESLGAYDIELNLAQHWINLFSQDHCPGQVVYWGEAYLQAPIEVNEAGQILVETKLDGQRLQALIDTGSSHSSIRQGDAAWLFGMTPQSPGVVPADPTDAADGGQLTAYRAPFKTLEVAGITFNNPEINILPSVKESGGSERAGRLAPRKAPVLTLGVNELRRLRLYLALRERMLYMTPAKADDPT